MKKNLYIVILGLSSQLSYAGIFGASNFDDCVLDSMKGVTSDIAARSIYQSCRQKFPEKQVKNNAKNLSTSELSMLTGRGGPAQVGNYFSVDLLNGNNELTVSAVTLAVTTKISGKVVTNYYDADVTIGPKKTGNIFVKYIAGDDGAKYEWGISAAKGY